MSTLWNDRIYRDIVGRMSCLHDEIRVLNKARDQRVTELQTQCNHDWRFIPDPSGNNDSEYHCDKCALYSRTRK